MSRSLQRGGFSHSDATARHTNRKSTRMNRKTDPVSADLKRIPGLYRRWELPEILKDQRAYRIENAGAHQDGTPLVAVYADEGSEGEGSDSACWIPSVEILARHTGARLEALAAERAAALAREAVALGS